MIVAVGTLEDKPADISYISEILNMSRSTVHRKLKYLVKEGWVELQPTGKHTYVYITDRGVKHYDPVVDKIVQHIKHMYTRLERDVKNETK